MSKLLKNFVGIDIAKHKFDVAVLKGPRATAAVHNQFNQTPDGFIEFEEWLNQQGVFLDAETLFCMEHTGIYNLALVEYLCNKSALVWVEMAIKIKRSEGFERGSNDKSDALKIAWYAARFNDRTQLYRPVNKRLSKLKTLIAQRQGVVKVICQLTVPVKEIKEVSSIRGACEVEKLQRVVVAHLLKLQKSIEAMIAKIVKEDSELFHKVERLKSIKGIGQVTAVTLLVYTNGFTTFRTAKQLACYIGVVPFIKKQSGISIKSRAQVSQFANKKLKTLLDLCASTAIQHDTELKAYYERKQAEGKNKKLIINAVRNKLVLRMFAVLRDDRDYTENYVRKCA